MYLIVGSSVSQECYRIRIMVYQIKMIVDRNNFKIGKHNSCMYKINLNT